MSDSDYSDSVKIIQDNWSRRLPLKHKNVASTGAPLKHIIGNEFNIIQFILTYISTYRPPTVYNKLKQNSDLRNLYY